MLATKCESKYWPECSVLVEFAWKIYVSRSAFDLPIVCIP